MPHIIRPYIIHLVLVPTGFPLKIKVFMALVLYTVFEMLYDIWYISLRSWSSIAYMGNFKFKNWFSSSFVEFFLFIAVCLEHLFLTLCCTLAVGRTHQRLDTTVGSGSLRQTRTPCRFSWILASSTVRQFCIWFMDNPGHFCFKANDNNYKPCLFSCCCCRFLPLGPSYWNKSVKKMSEISLFNVQLKVYMGNV